MGAAQGSAQGRHTDPEVPRADASKLGLSSSPGLEHGAQHGQDPGEQEAPVGWGLVSAGGTQRGGEVPSWVLLPLRCTGTAPVQGPLWLAKF